MTVSRAEFEQAIQGWLTNGSAGIDSNYSGLRSIDPADWTLRYSPLTNYAYLERRGKLLAYKRSSSVITRSGDLHPDVLDVIDDAEMHDEATATSAPQLGQYTAFANFSVVYSPSYQVPCLYFRVCSPDGTPLQLADALATSLFQPFAVDGTPTAKSENEDSRPFPTLSQAEHPATGHPCLMLHPCETASTLDEILKTAGGLRPGGLDVLKAWFMLVSTFIDIR